MTSPRRSLAASLASAVAALSLAACMQTESKTTILADGSGTSVDVTTLDIARTKQIIDLVKMMGMFPNVPADLDVDKLLEAQYGQTALAEQLKATPGVEAKTVTSEVVDGKRVSKRDFAFADFASLNRTAFLMTSAKLEKNADGSWTLDMDALGAFRSMIPAPSPSDGTAKPDPTGGLGGFGFDPEALMQMLTDTVGDFRAKSTYVLPGEILETNGVKGEDGRTVTWTFALKDIQQAGADPANAPGKMSVRFKGEGLLLKPFRYVPKVNDLMKSRAPTTTKPTEPTKPAAPPQVTPTQPSEPAPSPSPAPVPAPAPVR